MFYVNTLITDA